MSVVTPSLNAERYIEQCILSVQAQEYPNVEHIIVDGKSNDCTIAIIRKYEGRYNLRWISERDRNASEATNKGMRLATGEILGILPADDLYLPWTVGTVVQKFRTKETDLVYGDLVEAPFEERFGTIYYNPPERDLRAHLRFNSIGGMAVFFKRRVFDALNGFDEGLRITSDYDFWIRAAREFEFSKVAEVLACFRFRKNSLSMNDSRTHQKEKSELRTRHHGTAASTISIREIGYYTIRSIVITEWLLNLFGGTFDRPRQERPWKNLLTIDCISRARLFREFLLSPIFSTNFLQQRLHHGYIDMERLFHGFSQKAHTPSKLESKN